MYVSNNDVIECSDNDFLESIEKEGTQISVKHRQDYPSPATQRDEHTFTPAVAVFRSLSSIPTEVNKGDPQYNHPVSAFLSHSLFSTEIPPLL